MPCNGRCTSSMSQEDLLHRASAVVQVKNAACRGSAAQFPAHVPRPVLPYCCGAKPEPCTAQKSKGTLQVHRACVVGTLTACMPAAGRQKPRPDQTWGTAQALTMSGQAAQWKLWNSSGPGRPGPTMPTPLAGTPGAAAQRMPPGSRHTGPPAHTATVHCQAAEAQQGKGGAFKPTACKSTCISGRQLIEFSTRPTPEQHITGEPASWPKSGPSKGLEAEMGCLKRAAWLLADQHTPLSGFEYCLRGTKVRKM